MTAGVFLGSVTVLRDSPPWRVQRELVLTCAVTLRADCIVATDISWKTTYPTLLTKPPSNATDGQADIDVLNNLFTGTHSRDYSSSYDVDLFV